MRKMTKNSVKTPYWLIISRDWGKNSTNWFTKFTAFAYLPKSSKAENARHIGPKPQCIRIGIMEGNFVLAIFFILTITKGSVRLGSYTMHLEYGSWKTRHVTWQDYD